MDKVASRIRLQITDIQLVTYDNNGKRDNLGANQPISEDRDSWLENLANELVEGLEYEDGIEGTLSPVVSAPRRSLTHGRVLTFECAGKKLCIYPDGGFMNGWFIYNAPGERKMYDLSTITYDTEIDICRNQDIKKKIITREKITKHKFHIF